MHLNKLQYMYVKKPLSNKGVDVLNDLESELKNIKFTSCKFNKTRKVFRLCILLYILYNYKSFFLYCK